MDTLEYISFLLQIISKMSLFISGAFFVPIIQKILKWKKKFHDFQDFR